MRPKSCMQSLVVFLLFSALLPCVAHAHSYVGTYKVLILVVDFSDESGSFDAETFQKDWVDSVVEYYWHMSSGQLTLEPTLVEHLIHLGERKYYHHCDLGTACINEWAGTDNPIQQAVDQGDIDATADGLTPAGGGAADVFDGILLISAPGVHNFYPGWSTSGQHPSADIASRTYDIGFADAIYTYGAAAHELGHMISGMYTHPAGYVSAYELMDSCYPCALGIFPRVDRSALTGGFLPWFSGWLPASSFVTYSPSGGGGTEVLAPIELWPEETAAPQGMQVLTKGGYSYICESRRYIAPDDILPLNPDVREGVLILKATPGADPETQLMLSPGYGEPGRWTSDFVNGESFFDSAQDVSIAIGPSVDQGATVTVTYGPNANATKPDIALIPWLTPPMDTFETVDIWVDSPINGFERDAPGDPNRLRYGRRTDTDNTVIGNGDDPCANEVNLVYARVRNLGSGSAADVVVHFEVTNPLGVGIRDDTGWTRFGTVTSADFPGLASIAPGAYVDVCAPWKPIVPTLTAEGIIPFHSCLRVVVDPVAGEVVTVNQDGDREQENVGWFELVKPENAAEYRPIDKHLFIVNKYEIAREYFLGVASKLPAGWQLEIGPEDQRYLLNANEVRDIPVHVTAPSGTKIGDSFFVDVRAYLKKRATKPDGSVQFDSVEVAGALIAAQAVTETKCIIAAEFESSPSRMIYVSGKLEPPIPGAYVSIRYESPNGGEILSLVEANGEGSFTDKRMIELLGVWKIRGLYAGTLEHSSAMSDEFLLTASVSTGCVGGTLETPVQGIPFRSAGGDLILIALALIALLIAGWRSAAKRRLRSQVL